MIIRHITAVNRRVSGLEFQRKENITEKLLAERNEEVKRRVKSVPTTLLL